MSIKGLDKLQKQLKNIGAAQYSKALLAGAYKLQELSQTDSPVDTGFMRTAHDSRETDTGAELVVNAEYAVYVHEGTKYMAGREWITKAIDNNMDVITNVVKNATEAIIKGEVK